MMGFGCPPPSLQIMFLLLCVKLTTAAACSELCILERGIFHVKLVDGALFLFMPWTFNRYKIKDYTILMHLRRVRGLKELTKNVRGYKILYFYGNWNIWTVLWSSVFFKIVLWYNVLSTVIAFGHIPENGSVKIKCYTFTKLEQARSQV